MFHFHCRNLQFSYWPSPTILSLFLILAISMPCLAGPVREAGSQGSSPLLRAGAAARGEMPVAEPGPVAAVVADSTGCVIDPPRIVFGPVLLGESAALDAVITNTGDAVLVLAPESDNPAFTVDGSTIEVQPGASATLTVHFEQTGREIARANISLGDNVCDYLRAVASPALGIEPDVDMLGLYWDEAHAINNATMSEGGTIVTGYLVLANPIIAGGVAGWECRVEKVGAAQDLGWTLPATALNFGIYPDFIVGVGEPQPYETEVVLASVQYLVSGPYDVTLFSLVPTSIPSVEGRMSWVSGANFNLLLGMQPATGEPLVATINGDAPVAVLLPMPAAQTLGNRVELNWSVTGAEWDTYHVYRRVSGLPAERLLAAPQSAPGGMLNFADEIGSFTGGTRLFYSYAPVQAGQEVGRSAEVEVLVPDLPAVASGLRPNVPNPFNPQTEIRFVLSQPQNVDLRIYDVTGRLVATLVAADLPAGPNSRIWQGRDDQGRAVPSGAYYVRLTTREGVDSHKIMLLK